MIALRPAELMLFVVDKAVRTVNGLEVPVERVRDLRRGGQTGPWCIEGEGQTWWDCSEMGRLMRGEQRIAHR